MSRTGRGPRVGTGAGSDERPGSGSVTPRVGQAASAVAEATAYVAHFRARVVQDALIEASAAQWRVRATVFHAARPRPGDFTGRATPEQLAAIDTRLAAIALACRNRATFIELYGLAADVQREVAVELGRAA